MIRTLVRSRALRALVAFAAVIVASGCDLSTAPPMPHILTIIGGTEQAVAVGTQATAPLQVVVIDQYQFVLPGVQIVWTITDGGGSLSTTAGEALNTVTVPTDESGISTVNYTAGPTATDAHITAEVVGVFHVTFVEHVH
jgi:hypothetical protein